MIRVDGDIRRINVPPLDSKEVYALIYEIMNDKQRKDFEMLSLQGQCFQSESRLRRGISNDSLKGTHNG